MKYPPDNLCPCESGALYKGCCGRVHSRRADYAPELCVRARYSAYVVGLPRFILLNTHPDSPHFQEDPRAWTADIEHFCSLTEFDGLEVIEEEVFGEEAWVTFEVYLSQDGQDASFTERSCFRRHEGRWTYWDGEVVS